VTETLFEWQSYYVSDRPRDYGPNRRCTIPRERCKTAEQCGEVGKIHRFVHPHRKTDDERDLILLCALCEKDRILRFLTPEQYQHGWDAGL
jgi:hypothetical protein